MIFPLRSVCRKGLNEAGDDDEEDHEGNDDDGSGDGGGNGGRRTSAGLEGWEYAHMKTLS